MNPLDVLLARLRRARRWPIPNEVEVRRRLALWVALRESDEARLRLVMKWKQDRDLIIDNLPEKIASAYGDLLFGGEPTFEATEVADRERETEMVRGWSEELPAAEETNVSEGEVWWRLSLVLGIPHPVLTWHSRADVVPLLHGRTVRAVGFVSALHNEAGGQEIWRHIELHAPGVMANTLWRGRKDVLGQEVDLGRHPETADLVPEWRHGLDGMLGGRIVHKWGRRPHCGVSIYRGVWTRFLGLNEATTIGKENVRLTAKKRITAPASALRAPPPRPDGSVGSIDNGDGSRTPIQPAAQFDAGEDVLLVDELDVTEGAGGSSSPFKVLEYSFEAEALIAWLRFEIETICQRCDLVPQFIGSGDFGIGSSGTALRVRLLPTVNAAQGAARPWDRATPEIARTGQLLEALPVALGGLGREEWINPGAIPAVERAPELPIDENEVAQRHATLKTADLLSIETSLRERYPDRDDDWYVAEVDRIRADMGSSMPPVTFGAGAGGGGTPPSTE